MTNIENAENDHGKAAPKDAAALRKRLRDLMGDDALAYLDLQLPEQHAPDETQKKHNARTAQYKANKALQLAPDSEAVRQATSNILLGLLLANGPASPNLFRRSMQELVDAGYDQEESRTSLLRLLATFDDRKKAWQRRTRQKLARAIIKRLQKFVR